MNPRYAIALFCLVLSTSLSAKTSWIIIGNGKFSHDEAKLYSSVCIKGANYSFTLDNAGGGVKSAYKIVGLKQNPYWVMYGYMGLCKQNDKATRERLPMVSNPQDPSIETVLKKFHMNRQVNGSWYRGDNLDRAKDFLNGPFSASHSLDKTIWHLPNTDSIVQECLNTNFKGEDPGTLQGTSFKVFFVSKTGNSTPIIQKDMQVRFECNCGLDSLLRCPYIDDVSDVNSDGVLEFIVVQEEVESSCQIVKVDETRKDGIVTVFNQTYCSQ